MSPIEVQRRTPNAVAHYLRPARWVGTAPDWAHPNPQLDPQPAQLGELVVERDLPDSIRARAFRDGMVAFLLGDRAPSRGDDLPSWIYYGVRLMNAHLACLHAAADAPFTAAVVTPWSMMQVEFDSGNLTEMNPLDDLWTITLALARNPNTKSTDGVVDYRYFRPAPTVGVDALDRSFDLLASLLACDDRDAVLLRARASSPS